MVPLVMLVALALDSPAGVWKTIDDKTGKPRGYIRIYERNGLYFGKIEKSVTPERDHNRVCGACKDDRKNKPIVGLEIMRNMKFEDGEYRNGDILDPDSGTTYRCKFRLIDGGAKMLLRGFIGFSLIGRTQTWIREKE